MFTEIDPNKLIIDFLQSNLDNILVLAQNTMKGAKNTIRSKLSQTYSNYLKTILEKYSKVKTFFIRSEPTSLYKFYVPLGVSNMSQKLNDPGIAELTSISNFIIIKGTGGSGKSMFMRHLLISTISDKQKTPVFIELRKVYPDNETIQDSLLYFMQINGLNIDEEYLHIALEAGHFCILLDGFDELTLENRDIGIKEINYLSEKFPKNWFVISSRSDSKLSALSNFTEFDIDSLSLEKAIQLVHKLPFDDPIKEKFIDDMKKELFEKHKSFLSNPLLLSIMLLTYSDVAHIPEKLSVFYNQAYESLFQKHDALKGGFQRERRSKLDIQDFAHAFSAFCLQSYDKRTFSFSFNEALELFEKGKALSSISYENEAILNDAIQSVCLLIEDGLEITFAHRSFQEYFVAKYIQSSPVNIKIKLINRFSEYIDRDEVIPLLYEIDPIPVEKYFILPQLDKLKSELRIIQKVGISHFLRYLKLVIHKIKYDENINILLGIKNYHYF